MRLMAGLAAASATMLGLHFLDIHAWPGDVVSFDIDTLVPYASVVLGAALCVALDVIRPLSDSGGTARLAMVASVLALITYGAQAAVVTGIASALAGTILSRRQDADYRVVAIDVLAGTVATAAAGFAYDHLHAPPIPGTWPWLALPAAGVAVTYAAVSCAIYDFGGHLTGTVEHALNWPAHGFRGVPSHVVGVAATFAVAAIVEQRAWNVLIAALIPLACLWLIYRSGPAPRERELRAEFTRPTDHGLVIIDRRSLVQRWNAGMTDLIGISDARGRGVVSLLAQNGRSEFAQAIAATLETGTPRSVSRLSLTTSKGPRVLSMTSLPDAEGALLVFRDCTEQANWERSQRENAERFTIVSEAANDGIWELDIAGGGLFFTARYQAMVGLPAVDARTTRDEWLARAHPDDRGELERALESIVTRKVNRFELTHRLRHENGSYRTVVCRAVAVHDQRGTPVRAGGSITDITETAIAQAKIHSAESRDALTGLLNRAAFVADLGRRLSEYREGRTKRFAALYLDLDRFKIVNDSLGHLVGDELLIEASRRLETCLRPGDAIARLGGDEFAIMLHDLQDEMQANVVGFRLQEALNTPFNIGGREVVTSASIGIAFCRKEYESAEEIMRDADTAMYHAKAHGKARHELFDADMHARAVDRLGLESDLRVAVRNSSFEVHYQPIVALTTRTCVGFESLVRWNRNGVPVSPSDFIPMAEELGLIEPLGIWIMEQACQAFADWRHRFPASGLESITVNVSARQLMQQGFNYLVEQIVERHGMKRSELRLEITETALMETPQYAAKVLEELRECGIQIYLDDFGTGYSSLSHLHKLPVDALKIDRSFIRGLLHPGRTPIVESILALARTLNTSVVAEGVEDEAQAAELERLGCQFGQGYYFSRPISQEAVTAILASGTPLGDRRTDGVAQARRRAMTSVLSREIA